MAKTLKQQKEDFVSNLSGGEIGEINWVTLVAASAVTLWSALQSRHAFFTPYSPPALLADFLLNVCAILVATTIYADAPVLLNILILTPAALVTLTTSPKARPRRPKVEPAGSGHDSNKAKAGSQLMPAALPVRPFVTAYRGSMLVITCLAILAVDFQIFPRRFAKVENWGTSLMDLGVGSFVFSAGFVSARPLLKKDGSSSSSTNSVLHRALASIRHAIPLLILGFARLYSVKNLDYAEHVTEYGVHWNFFFTLSLLPPFAELYTLFHKLIPSYSVLAGLTGIIYQISLDSTSLKAFILVSPRGDDLLSKNREGIFSFAGYLAIFLAGRGLGLAVLPRQSRRNLLKALALRAAIWTFLSAVSQYTTLVDPVSRRLANLPYVLWICAFNAVQLLLYCLIETFYFPSVSASETVSTTSSNEASTEREEARFATSKILEVFNKHGLVVFLLANLGTGAVNLSLDTLHMRTLGAVGVMLGYGAAVTGVALGLDYFGVKIKL